MIESNLTRKRVYKVTISDRKYKFWGTGGTIWCRWGRTGFNVRDGVNVGLLWARYCWGTWIV